MFTLLHFFDKIRNNHGINYFYILAPQVTNLAYAPAFLMKNNIILGKSEKMSDFLKNQIS